MWSAKRQSGRWQRPACTTGKIHLYIPVSYTHLVEAYEQRQIANNAARKNRLKLGDTDINESIQAEQNLLDVQQLLVTLSREKQPLIHCAVFLELKARSMSALESLQSDISMELTRSKITVDRLTLRQKEGFRCV